MTAMHPLTYYHI